MRFRIAIALLLIFSLIICSTSYSESMRGSIVFSPYIGTGIPVSDFADDDPDNPDGLYRQTGLKFGAAAEYFLGARLSLGVSFMYAMFDAQEVEGFETGGDLKTLMVGLQGRYLYERFTRAKPYAVIGFGLTTNSISDGRFRYDTDIGDYKLDTKFYINGGLGLQYNLKPSISLFLEGGLDILLTRDAQINIDGEPVRDPETDEPLEIGSNYYFIDFRAGVNFWFGRDE